MPRFSPELRAGNRRESSKAAIGQERAASFRALTASIFSTNAEPNGRFPSSQRLCFSRHHEHSWHARRRVPRGGEA